MHVQDVLPKIVDLINFASTCSSLVVLAKRRGDVVRASCNKSSNTQTDSEASKALKDVTNTSIGNNYYMSIKFLKN